MNKPLLYASLIASLNLGACTTILENIPGVYTLDIHQGNIIDQDMINQLRPNMNKRQVLYIMGSPMLVDIFHQRRWDYIYSEQHEGIRKQKRMSLFFDGDILIGVQGDYRPTSLPVVTPSKESTIDVPKRKRKKTLFEKIGSIFSFDDDESPAPVEDNKTEKSDVKTEDQATPIKQDVPTEQPIATDTSGVDINALPESEIQTDTVSPVESESIIQEDDEIIVLDPEALPE